MNQIINTELENITCLYEVTKMLASSTDLHDSLEHIMEILSVRKNMHNGTVSIVNPHTGQLEIEVAFGMPVEARKRGKYKVGEGITGKVVDTGRSVASNSPASAATSESAPSRNTLRRRASGWPSTDRTELQEPHEQPTA